MDAFFAITLSVIVLRAWWKHQKANRIESRRNTVKNRWDSRKRRKITDEEVITVVIPTINNDK